MRKSLMLSFANASWLVCWSVLSELALVLGHLPAIALNMDANRQLLAQAAPTTSLNRPILKLGSEGAAVSELQAALKLLGFYTDVVDGVYRESTAIAVSQFQKSAGLTPDGIAGPATWNQLFPSASSTSTASTPSPSSASTSSRTSASSFPVPSILQNSTPTSRVNPTTPAEPARRNPTNRQPRSRPAASTSEITTSNSSSSLSPQSTAVTLPILRRGMQGPAVAQLQERLKTLGFFQGTANGVFGAATQAAVQAAQQNFNIQPDGVVGPATWRALLR